jgi:hypothetical protein
VRLGGRSRVFVLFMVGRSRVLGVLFVVGSRVRLGSGLGSGSRAGLGGGRSTLGVRLGSGAGLGGGRSTLGVGHGSGSRLGSELGSGVRSGARFLFVLFRVGNFFSLFLGEVFVSVISDVMGPFIVRGFVGTVSSSVVDVINGGVHEVEHLLLGHTVLTGVHLKSGFEGSVVHCVHVVVEVNIEVVLEFSDKSFTFSLVEVLVSVLVNVIEGFVDHTSLTFGEVSKATDVGVVGPVLGLGGELDSRSGGSDKGSGFEHLFFVVVDF